MGWADTVIVLGLIINGLAGPLIVLVLALVDGFVYGWRPTNLAIPLPALVLQLALWRWFGDDIFVAGEKAHLLDGRYDE